MRQKASITKDSASLSENTDSPKKATAFLVSALEICNEIRG